MFNGKASAGLGGAGNFMKGLQTPAGSRLHMNDKDGSVKMTDKGGASMKMDGAGNVAHNSAASHVVNVGGKKGNPQSLIKADSGGNITIDGKTSITLKVGDNSITISGSGITASAGKGTIDITALAGALTISNTGGTMDITTDGALTITGGATAAISSGDTNIM